MKKLILAIGLICVIVGTLVFINKPYYPPLPIGNMSKKEMLKKVNPSQSQMINLTNENGQEWYIISERDMSEAGEKIKELVHQYDWTFKQKEGSSLFFEKQNEQLIVSTQMWTSDYVLVKIPANFNE